MWNMTHSCAGHDAFGMWDMTHLVCETWRILTVCAQIAALPQGTPANTCVGLTRTGRVRMWDMTHEHMWHAVCIWNMIYSCDHITELPHGPPAKTCVGLIHMGDMTHSHVGLVSFVCWDLTPFCGTFFLHIRSDSFIRVTWRDAFKYATWSIHIWDTTLSYMWHIFLYVRYIETYFGPLERRYFSDMMGHIPHLTWWVNSHVCHIPYAIIPYVISHISHDGSYPICHDPFMQYPICHIPICYIPYAISNITHVGLYPICHIYPICHTCEIHSSPEAHTTLARFCNTHA